MSDRDEETIARLRRAYEAFSRTDFDTAMDIAHPEIELVPPGGQSPLKGADALRAWMEPDALGEQQIEPREFASTATRLSFAKTSGPAEPGAASSWMSTCGPSGPWTTTAS